MSPSLGYYSLIQYCPDLARLEAANVGVLLFCPERQFLKAMTARDNRRIRHFFGAEGNDWARINSFKLGLVERLELERSNIHTLADLEHFIALRANAIQISPPRSMKVTDPEQDLQRLFAEMFGEREERARGKSLQTVVGEKLHQAGLENKLRTNIVVTVPALDRNIEVPFGYQNGRFNLITPTKFGAADPERSVTQAYKFAVQGRSLYEHPHGDLGDLQLVVVAKFRAHDRESPTRIAHLFEDFGVKLFTMRQLPDLIEEIRDTGKDLHVTSRRN